jgi:hypothetical protein
MQPDTNQERTMGRNATESRFIVVAWTGDDGSRWFDVVDTTIGGGGYMTRAGVVRTVNRWAEADATAKTLNG